MNLDPFKRVLNRLTHYMRAALLPAALVFSFMVQNAAFNSWSHLATQPYLRLYAATFALGVLLYGPSMFIKPRWRYVYLIVISTCVSVLLTAEYLYHSYDGGLLQISAFKLMGESSAITGTILRLLTPNLLLFFCNIFLVLIAFFLAHHRKLLPISLTFGEKILAVIIILTAVFGGYGTLFAAEKRQWGDDSRLYSQLYDLDSVVGKMGVVNYFLEDAAKRAMTSGKVTDDDKAFVQKWSAERPTSTQPIDQKFGIAKGRNLIFIQVESLENAVINQKIGDNEITPNLNALAKQGLYYSNYFTQVDMGNTADAEFVTLNSLYPLPDSVAFVDHAQNRYTALPQLLDDHGYHTYVFHGDVPTFWNRADIYPGLGYQTTFMKDDFTSSRPIGITGLGDEDFLDQSLTKIKTLQEPFMATLITLSSHTPFILPEDLRTLPIPEDSSLNDTQKQYLESLHYTDRAIGEFIDQLKQSKIYDDSVIVIFGDHGSYTGISEALGTEKDDVNSTNDAQVPLIVLAPGTNLKGEQKIPASHLDIYPTVASLLGLKAPSSILGQDLLDTKTPVVVQRKSGTGAIRAILMNDKIYAASEDGTFENGTCLAADTRQTLPIDECKALYDQQTAVLRVSDTVVRGDMIDALAAVAD